jgi:uncharacterized protein YndB with AHSA1/START domain
MNVQVIQVAPVRKSIVVKAPQKHAFDVFAAGFDSWWPKSHHIGRSEMKRAVIEPAEGGRWYEKGEDGSECDWGRVLAWEPPSRLVLSWHINAKFQPDQSVHSEVELRFTAENEQTTRVELEHRITAPDAETLRAAVDSPQGWGSLLEIFAIKAALSNSRE